ncbi:SDR family oxidoreductase [Streptomyces sp. NPDC005562]|uniref:SDR family oxidoreductase n=1 Tax=unclassified Streptomyces TaxID=2593676 RepID=UPI0033B45DFD
MSRRRRRSVLEGRVAVVTGAGRGLGEAVARELADRGAKVALVGLEESELARVGAGLPATAASRHWHVDVTDHVAMARVAAEVRERMGAVSVVVANAGVAEAGPFEGSDPERWRRVIEVNLVGSAVTARAFLPQLLATHGHYLQIASLASVGATPLMTAYCASKAGVEAFCHALRAEVRTRGVGVGVGYPNWIDTDMIRDAGRSSALAALKAELPAPARRVQAPDQVARRLVSAVERRASSVYVPRWLRPAQVVRAALPGLVTRVLGPDLSRAGHPETGLLGAGGRATPPPGQ